MTNRQMATHADKELAPNSSALQEWIAGSLVKLRGRSWIVEEVRGDDDSLLLLKPLGASDEETSWVYLPLEPEPPQKDSFPPPLAGQAQASAAGFLLYDALRLSMRWGAGPFRSFSNLSFEPRPYQLVPLMMALKQQPAVRLLIGDDVGVGKTVEAGLILKELLERKEIERFAVICPPHLCEQWQTELLEKFSLHTTIITSKSIHSIERALPQGHSLFEEHPYTVISLEFIKNEKRSNEFARLCPEFVIVEEVDTCVGSGLQRQKRFMLLQQLSADQNRHMVLLSATPHHGDDEAFCRLLSLLHPGFIALQGDLGNTHNELWQKLAAYFVQRRRADIEEWKSGSFFPIKERARASYHLSPAWAQFFEELRSYAKNSVISAETQGKAMLRHCGFAMLQLLRCASSSPAAAVQALKQRLDGKKWAYGVEEEDLSEEFIEEALSQNSDEREDLIEEDQPLVKNERDLLTALLAKAEKLKGLKADPKLSLLLSRLHELLAEGFRPVIFCHFVSTADYLSEQLRKTLPLVQVEKITGQLSGDERKERIEKLEVHEGDYLLVATDCISLGINLHRAFNAVIHYDMVWNPTRHEQREGRVDRYGQPRPSVRTLLLFGSDNEMDLHVMKVIADKMRKIQQNLGVKVSMAADEEDLQASLIDRVILGKERKELQLSFLGEEELNRTPDWEDVRKNLRQSQTKFVQKSLKHDEVYKEWLNHAEKIGDSSDVERLVAAYAEKTGVSLHPLNTTKSYRWAIQELPERSKRRLIQQGIAVQEPLKFSFHYPPAPGVLYMHRTSPLVKALCQELIDSSIHSQDGIAARCSALFCDIVKEATTVALIRVRYTIQSQSTSFKIDMLPSEECLIIAYTPSQGIKLLNSNEAQCFFSCEPVRNMIEPTRKTQVDLGLKALSEIENKIYEIIDARAHKLEEDHLRVREASKFTGKKRVKVTPFFPYDLVGVYRFIPQPKF